MKTFSSSRHAIACCAVAGCLLSMPALAADPSASPPPDVPANEPGALNKAMREGRDEETTTPPVDMPLAKDDKTHLQSATVFIAEAAISSQSIIATSELAKTRSSDAGIKQLAIELTATHQQVLDQLSTLASVKSAKLPAKLDAKRDAEKGRLADAKDKDFDKAYLTQVTQDQKALTTYYEKTASQDLDKEVKVFAKTQLPVMRQGAARVATEYQRVSAK